MGAHGIDADEARAVLAELRAAPLGKVHDVGERLASAVHGYLMAGVSTDIRSATAFVRDAYRLIESVEKEEEIERKKQGEQDNSFASTVKKTRSCRAPLGTFGLPAGSFVVDELTVLTFSPLMKMSPTRTREVLLLVPDGANTLFLHGHDEGQLARLAKRVLASPRDATSHGLAQPGASVGVRLASTFGRYFDVSTAVRTLTTPAGADLEAARAQALASVEKAVAAPVRDVSFWLSPSPKDAAGNVRLTGRGYFSALEEGFQRVISPWVNLFLMLTLGTFVP